MTATATLSNSTTQNVTSQATWQSSNQVVATVNIGLVTALQAGTVDITATYQNVNGSVRLTVPQPVVLIYTLSGTVTDGTSGGILPGIRMSITTGTNAGLSTTTDSTGKYSISGISAGSMTVSAPATSYQTLDKVVTVTGSTSDIV
ncbi:MAG: hypothetical protein DMF95_18925 [Acidobacteria bacterium]|nr:MAG: hypothetical protein DMF95_18925 [Acidobacteriota bacterium]